MKQLKKRMAFLTMLLVMWTINPHLIYSQSSCQTALTHQPSTSYQLDTIQTNDTIIWTSFTANTTGVTIAADSIAGLNYHHVVGIELYDGSCSSPNLIASVYDGFESETAVSIFYDQLSIGNGYLIKYIEVNK